MVEPTEGAVAILSYDEFMGGARAFAAINWVGVECETIPLLSTCNSDCVFCLQDSVENEPKLFREMPGGDDKVGSFCLGEPTLNRTLFTHIAAARERYDELMLFTNGRPLRAAGLVRDLAEAGIDTFCVALHGPTAELHDELTRAPGGFEQTIAGIDNVLEVVGPSQVLINCMLTRQNLPLMEELLAFIEARGLRRIHFTAVVPMGRCIPVYREVTPTYTEMARTFAALAKRRSARPVDGLKAALCGVPACVSARAGLALVNQPNKEVFPIEISKGAICEGCRFSYPCRGVWEHYSDAFGWDEFGGAG